MNKQDLNIESALQDYIKPLTHPADISDSPLSKQLYKDYQTNTQNKLSRYLDSPRLDNRLIKQKNYLTLNHRKGEFHVYSNNQQQWHIDLRIAEKQLNEITGEGGALISIHVHYYRHQQRTTLPCELVAEQEKMINNQDYTLFTVALDKLAIKALAFDPERISMTVGISGTRCEMTVVVVFIQD